MTDLPAIYIGIDPGMEGAFALIYPDNNIQSWHTPLHVKRTKLPRAVTKSGKPKVKVDRNYNYRDMHLALYQVRKMVDDGIYRVVVGIERQMGRETDKKTVVFAVGRNQGIWEALVAANKLLPLMIMPSAWKPCYLLPGAPKSASLSLALELYPNNDFNINPRTDEPYKREEARAEALLIADYCKRKDQGLPFLRKRAAPNRKRAKAQKKRRRARKSKLLPHQC